MTTETNDKATTAAEQGAHVAPEKAPSKKPSLRGWSTKESHALRTPTGKRAGALTARLKRIGPALKRSFAAGSPRGGIHGTGTGTALLLGPVREADGPLPPTGDATHRLRHWKPPRARREGTRQAAGARQSEDLRPAIPARMPRAAPETRSGAPSRPSWYFALPSPYDAPG